MLHRPLYRRKAGYSFIRSLNPAAWFRAGVGQTVTGSGVSTWADQSGNGRDLLQSTDASRPPYLSYSGTKYLYLPGAASNYASTPNAAANQITGDIDVRYQLSLADFTPSAAQTIGGKYGAAGNRSWWVYINTDGTIHFVRSSDGTATTDSASTAATGVTDGAIKWIRIVYDSNNGAAGNDTKFYLSDDGASWTQLGNTVTVATAATLFNSTAAVEAGGINGGTSFAPTGKLYRAIIKNGIDGTTVVDFNPNADASDGSTSFASSATGETWTVNSSGGLPAQIVGRSSILFDGVADYLKCNAFTLNQPETVYIVFKQVSWTSADYVFDGNALNAGSLSQQVGTPNLGLYAGAFVYSNPDPALGSYAVMACILNGASSGVQTNNNSIVSGDAGAANLGGFTLGASGANANYGNLQVLEVLIFSTAHDATQRARIISYLAGRHGIAL